MSCSAIAPIAPIGTLLILLGLQMIGVAIQILSGNESVARLGKGISLVIIGVMLGIILPLVTFLMSPQ